MVQVEAEVVLFDHLLKVAIRCRNNSRVGVDRFRTSNTLKFLLLQQTQYFALQQRRHVTDLIKEDGAVVALFELPDVTPLCSGESTFLVSKKFALKKRL